MADAYGAIVVGFSDDFNGNKEGIANYLSSLGLSNSVSEFEVKDNLIWSSDIGGTQYPTLTPTRHKIVSIMVDGVEVKKHINDVSDEEFEDIYDVIEEEEVPLSEIASSLAANIESGVLYLTCCSNEKQRSVDSEFLSVSANGSAKRVSISHWVGQEAKVTEETC